MKQSMQEFKKCFFDALQMMLEAFLPVLAKCSLFMSQLLGVLAFILFGIGGIWSVMGHGNEPFIPIQDPKKKSFSLIEVKRRLARRFSNEESGGSVATFELRPYKRGSLGRNQ